MRTGIIIFVFTRCLDSFAQLEIMDGFMKDLEAGENPFVVIPEERQGFLLLGERMSPDQDGDYQWELLQYNTDLEHERTFLVSTRFMYDVLGDTYSEDMIYLLFGGVKNFKRRIIIYRIDSNNGSAVPIELDTFFPREVSYFSIFNKTLIIGGIERSRPSFVFYNLINERPVILPGFYSKNLSIYDISIDEINKLFTVVSGYINNDRQMAINIRSYDDLGQPVEDERIDPKEDHEFVHAKGMIANRNVRILAGLYKYRKSIYPEGVFLSSLLIDGNVKTRYHPFHELFGQLDSIHAEVEDREFNTMIGNRINPDKLNWYITLLNEYKDENIAIIESYQIEDRSPSLIKRVEKFHYPYALIFGFNDTLEITWVNDFAIEPITSDTFHKNLRIIPYSDSLKLFYFNKNVLSGKTIRPEEIADSRFLYSLDKLNSGNESNGVYYNNLSDFIRWYDNYFLFSGVKPGEDKDMFFIKKINFK